MYRVLSNIMHHNTGVRTTERDIRLQMVQVGGKGRGREGRCRREGKGGRREERAMRNPTRPLPPRRWWTCGGCSGTPCCIPLNPKFPPPPPTQVVDLRQWLRDHLLYHIDESQVDMQEVPASQRLAEVGGEGGEGGEGISASGRVRNRLVTWSAGDLYKQELKGALPTPSTSRSSRGHYPHLLSPHSGLHPAPAHPGHQRQRAAPRAAAAASR